MSISRWIVAVPVLAGLVVTGSAMARMLPAETVRDTVYQTCAHNGVHFNKQGHANCGLHKGWSDEPTTEPGDEPGGEPVEGPVTEPGSGGHHSHGPKHTEKVHHGKSDHGKGHGGGTTHGPSTHGGGNGHGGGSTHSHGGGNGHAGGNGHGKHSS